MVLLFDAKDGAQAPLVKLLQQPDLLPGGTREKKGKKKKKFNRISRMNVGNAIMQHVYIKKNI